MHRTGLAKWCGEKTCSVQVMQELVTSRSIEFSYNIDQTSLASWTCMAGFGQRSQTVWIKKVPSKIKVFICNFEWLRGS